MRIVARMMAGLCVLGALFQWVTSVDAVTFPIYSKTMDARTAFNTPEGYCSVVILKDTKPKELIKEPYIATKKFYGWLFSGESPVVLGDNYPTPDSTANWGQPKMLVCLRESSVGNGYDTAIIDLNMNNDLTDDPVFRDKKVCSYRKFFGPFLLSLPKNVVTANSEIRPYMYLETGFMGAPRVYTDPTTKEEVRFYGFAAVRQGWFLEGTVDMNGVLQKFAFKDSNCDFKFVPHVRHREILNDELYFDGGKKVSALEFFPDDYVLRDYSNNGVYECELPLGECDPLGKYILVGGKLNTLTISPDADSVTIEPVDSGKVQTGIFRVEKPSDKRTWVALSSGYTAPTEESGSFTGEDMWQLISIDYNVKESQLPVGDYVLSKFALRSMDSNGKIAHFPLDAFSERKTISFKIAENEAFTSCWGQPMSLSVEAYPPADQSATLQIYINLKGSNGECYTDFSVYDPVTYVVNSMNGPSLEILVNGASVGSHPFLNDYLGWWWKTPEELKGKEITLVPMFKEVPVKCIPLKTKV